MKLKTKIAIIITVVLAVSITAIGLGLGLNSPKALDEEDATVFTANWMKYLKDDVLVKNTVIPGSHDAGSKGMMWAAETQNRTIAEQLACGSRYLDLRVWKSGNEYYIFHAIIKGEKFIPIVEDINKFLDEHPTEFLILDMQKFKGKSQDDVINILATKLGDKIVQNNTSSSDIAFIDSLTVGEMRGKCLVFWGDDKTVDHGDYLFLRDKNKGTRENAALRSFYYRVYNTLASKDYIKHGLTKYWKLREEKSAGLFVLQGQLTDPVFVVGPKAVEALHNKNMSEYLNTFDCSEHQLNIVMRDYLGARKCLEILVLNLGYDNIQPALLAEFKAGCPEELTARFE
ncbi:MAG: phosphatidylinositol-specific phospholipase C domain-containing protein [Clostridia bacterium]|nr:phosphatidylinositol-specific phospholipase C domain-containing protein [Clostridia bacterium]